MTPDLLRLSPNLLRCLLLDDAFLFPGLTRRHTIFRLSKDLLRSLLPEDLLRLRLLPLLPTASAFATTSAIAASRGWAALLLLLSRRTSVRIAAAVSFTLAERVLIQAQYQ